METNNGQGSYILATELWVQVCEKLDNLHHVENFCLAYETVRPFLATHINKLKEEQERMALLLVVQNGFVNAKTGLKMRLVSKNWCRTMDDFYSRPHARKSCLPPSYFPEVTIKVPLDEARAKMIQEFAENQECQFVGGRVRLRWSETDLPLQSPLEDASFQSICKRATNLIVDWCIYSARMLDLCRPFLRHMCNVKCISSNLDIDNERIIICLPHLEKLDFIKVNNSIDFGDGRNDWIQVFQGCKSNLKFFECSLYTPDMQLALLKVKMDSLKDLRATEHWWSMREHDEDEKRSENGQSFIMNLHVPQLKVLFPKLKRIAVPCFKGYLGEDVDKEWYFPRLLLLASKNIQALEEIEINVDCITDVSIRKYPIHRRNLQKGSSTVRKLVVSFYYFENEELNTDTIQWCLSLANIWPSLRFLMVQILDYDSMGWFPSRGLRYEKRGDDWKLLLKCTKFR